MQSDKIVALHKLEITQIFLPSYVGSNNNIVFFCKRGSSLNWTMISFDHFASGIHGQAGIKSISNVGKGGFYPESTDAFDISSNI